MYECMYVCMYVCMYGHPFIYWHPTMMSNLDTNETGLIIPIPNKQFFSPTTGTGPFLQIESIVIPRLGVPKTKPCIFVITLSTGND